MENLLDAGGAEDEGDGDELFGNNYEQDYRAIPQLDDYQANPGLVVNLFFITLQS